MLEQKWGRVITISSIYGHEAGGSPWYSMAKAAQIAFMKSLSVDPGLVGSGITFNSVAPGFILVPERGLDKKAKENPEEFQKFISHHCPQGRMGLPTEVADVVAFICSERATLINGACIAVDGGQSRGF